MPCHVYQVLSELKEYATEVDVDFVRKAVRAIGRCAIKVGRSRARAHTALASLGRWHGGGSTIELWMDGSVLHTLPLNPLSFPLSRWRRRRSAAWTRSWTLSKQRCGQGAHVLHGLDLHACMSLSLRSGAMALALHAVLKTDPALCLAGQLRCARGHCRHQGHFPQIPQPVRARAACVARTQLKRASCVHCALGCMLFSVCRPLRGHVAY